MTKEAPPALPPLHDWLPLLQDALARQGHFRWTLSGSSMAPTLPESCQIDIMPPPDRIPRGSLIVFAKGDALVAHRLVHKAGRHWVAQGDGRRTPDPWLLPQQVLGVVAAAYNEDGARIWPRPLSGLLGWLWVARAYGLAAWRRIRGR